jgi:hypothetical protein
MHLFIGVVDWLMGSIYQTNILAGQQMFGSNFFWQLLPSPIGVLICWIDKLGQQINQVCSMLTRDGSATVRICNEKSAYQREIDRAR